MRAVCGRHDVKHGPVLVQDTAGQERYRAIANSYYRGAVGVLLVFDVSARRTFLNLSRWMTELRKYAEDDVRLACPRVCRRDNRGGGRHM